MIYLLSILLSSRAISFILKPRSHLSLNLRPAGSENMNLMGLRSRMEQQPDYDPFFVRRSGQISLRQAGNQIERHSSDKLGADGKTQIFA